MASRHSSTLWLGGVRTQAGLSSRYGSGLGEGSRAKGDRRPYRRPVRRRPLSAFPSPCECGRVTGISTRLERRVQADFPHHANLVTAALVELTSDIFPSETRDSPAIERIQLAALLVAQGDLGRLDGALALGEQDWRDLLVAAGLADEGWQGRVAAELDSHGR